MRERSLDVPRRKLNGKREGNVSAPPRQRSAAVGSVGHTRDLSPARQQQLLLVRRVGIVQVLPDGLDVV
jgi:hypothetical protein